MLLKPDIHQFQQMVAEYSTHEGYKEMFQKVLTPDILRSRFWASVRQQLNAITVRVDTIVCLGFGSITRGDRNRTTKQHEFACAVSSYPSQQYATTSPTGATSSPIPIVAQDPS